MFDKYLASLPPPPPSLPLYRSDVLIAIIPGNDTSTTKSPPPVERDRPGCRSGGDASVDRSAIQPTIKRRSTEIRVSIRLYPSVNQATILLSIKLRSSCQSNYDPAVNNGDIDADATPTIRLPRQSFVNSRRYTSVCLSNPDDRTRGDYKVIYPTRVRSS